MKKIIIILCVFWMGFIFYMSSTNGEISHQQSTEVVNLIKNTETKLQTKGENETINKNTINQQQVNENNLDYVIRKNAHAFMYMILAFLVSGLFFIFNKRGKDAIVYILFICLFYAVTDEFHQSFVLGRTSLVSDVLVDFGGTLIGLTFFYLTYYKIYERYSIKRKESLKI
ncbi:hypothetical protein psyc5s11_32620 [Clostridium gelidum]|uniref:VanZ-like domain-containing protein n=1 Tax=Clostridium gelidum TaxID=704125 RepID=A0ABN6J1D0_9CLOT|nr:VanZ family protein [Clostridium gelidum]BCZ47195.1 hypothetical protein psyc5s11_32620 [Clostridium gelidum]